jgi:hypothetical protein
LAFVIKDFTYLESRFFICRELASRVVAFLLSGCMICGVGMFFELAKGSEIKYDGINKVTNCPLKPILKNKQLDEI